MLFGIYSMWLWTNNIFFVCRHFDKDKSGKLDHQEFKSCLRALGYDLPVVEEGQVDPEFQAILDMVDPNRFVSWLCLVHLMDPEF